eukprot:3054539-Lingulodinium_polyedra.AAC.1
MGTLGVDGAPDGSFLHDLQALLEFSLPGFSQEAYRAILAKRGEGEEDPLTATLPQDLLDEMDAEKYGQEMQDTW